MAFNSGIPDLQAVSVGGGIRTLFGMYLPPGGRIAAYVHHSGYVDGMAPEISQLLVTTVNAGLGRCRSGKGDLVVCLPGHSENLSAADSLSDLVAGTRIVGLGNGSIMPVLRWTATTSTLLLNVADVVLSGLHLKMEGDVVVAAITASAASCSIEDCDIEIASGASNKVTTGITLTTGADRFSFKRNRVRGTATHNCTNFLVVGALADVEIAHNRMLASATAANGLVHVTGIATSLDIHDNVILNTHTSSTSGITVDDVAATGVITQNMCATLNDGTVTAQGIILGASALVRCFQNFSCDEPIKSGTLTPAAGT